MWAPTDCSDSPDPRPGARAHHLRVPVSAPERAAIRAQAARAGLSVARYLRTVGQGYPLRSRVDDDGVRALARIDGDLARLTELLELWLADDARTRHFGAATVCALLARLEATQAQLAALMRGLAAPRARSASAAESAAAGKPQGAP